MSRLELKEEFRLGSVLYSIKHRQLVFITNKLGRCLKSPQSCFDKISVDSFVLPFFLRQ